MLDSGQCSPLHRSLTYVTGHYYIGDTELTPNWCNNRNSRLGRAMGKVKSRKVTAKATRRKPSARSDGSVKAARRSRSKAKAPYTGKKSGRAGKERGRGGAKSEKGARPELQIRKLDPLRVCGERTSVVQLFRVDEQLTEGRAAGARQVHLVFNDRHGWYCEHGRSCHAVSAVMRHAGIR